MPIKRSQRLLILRLKPVNILLEILMMQVNCLHCIQSISLRRHIVIRYTGLPNEEGDSHDGALNNACESTELFKAWPSVPSCASCASELLYRSVLHNDKLNLKENLWMLWCMERLEQLIINWKKYYIAVAWRYLRVKNNYFNLSVFFQITFEPFSWY